MSAAPCGATFDRNAPCATCNTVLLAHTPPPRVPALHCSIVEWTMVVSDMLSARAPPADVEDAVTIPSYMVTFMRFTSAEA
eukprot:2054975-Prymnesium_polylepis.1